METMSKILSLFMSLFISFLASMGLISPQNGSVSNYAYGPEASQVMDIYLPSSASNKESNSAVLVLHDGFFESGSKSNLKTTCESLVNRGYIAVALDYRLLSRDNKAVTVYSVVDDLTLAIQKLKDFSDEKNLGIKEIALAGDSAGGYYAMMYAYSRITQSPIKIAFTAARVAPSDMTYERWKDFYTDEKYIDLLNLMAGTSYQVSDLTANAALVNRTALYLSPVYYVNRSSVPTLFAYAPNDAIVPISNRDSLNTALTNHGVQHEYVEYSSASHDLSNIWNTLLKTADFSDLLIKYCNAYFS